MARRYRIGGANARAIAESIELEIAAGRLSPGARLPTIRALSAELGVSPTTVNGAFALLRAQGSILGNRRGGSVVVGRSVFQTAGPQAPPRDARDLAVANPDPAFLPALAPLLGRYGTTRLYGAPSENEALVAAARPWFASDDIDATHLAVAPGALDGIGRALATHVRPGDTVALEDPSYPPYRELARALFLRVVPIAMDERGIVPAALARALRPRVRALIVTPRAQNPTGAAFDAERARALRGVLREARDLLVVEDDYLAPLALAPLHSICGVGRWAHVRSLAKAYGPDLRVAPLAGDALTIARMRDRQRVDAGWVSHVLQSAAAALLADAATARLVARARRAYAGRVRLVTRALHEAGIAACGGGLTVWVPVDAEADVVARLLARGWAVDAGERYRFATPPAIRVAVGDLGDDDARAFVAEIVAVLAERAPTTRV